SARIPQRKDAPQTAVQVTRCRCLPTALAAERRPAAPRPFPARCMIPDGRRRPLRRSHSAPSSSARPLSCWAGCRCSEPRSVSSASSWSSSPRVAGLATKRLYTVAAAAALGVLASVAVTVALVGTVILPGRGAGPDPVAAAGESEELEEGTDETATPVAEEETTTADEQPARTEAENT